MTGDKPASPNRLMLKRSLIGALVIVVVSAAATTSSALLFFDRTVAKFKPVSVGHEMTPVLSGDPQTIMIAGSDRRHGDKKLGLKAALGHDDPGAHRSRARASR